MTTSHCKVFYHILWFKKRNLKHFIDFRPFEEFSVGTIFSTIKHLLNMEVTKVLCSHCGGIGKTESVGGAFMNTCNYCNGRGTRIRYQCDGIMKDKGPVHSYIDPNMRVYTCSECGVSIQCPSPAHVGFRHVDNLRYFSKPISTYDKSTSQYPIWFQPEDSELKYWD